MSPISRLLCALSLREEEGSRHCDPPDEANVFSRGVTRSEEKSPEDDQDEDQDQEALLPSCETDENGNFGPDDFSSSVMATYHYQVQTTLDLSAIELNDTVLRNLEKALSDLVVPQLLDRIACLSNAERRRLQINMDPTVSELSELVGIRATPDDAILAGSEGVRCVTLLVPNADRCFVVGGGFTLTGNNNIDWARPLALVLTRDLMNTGQLDNIHEDVLNVRFLKSVPVPENGPTTSNTRGTIAADDNGLPGYAWALIASGLVVFLVSVAYLIRRLNRKRNEDSTPQQYDDFDPESRHLRRTWSMGNDGRDQDVTSWNNVVVGNNDNQGAPLL